MNIILKNVRKGILAVTLVASVIGHASNDNSIIIKDAKKTDITLNNVKEGNLLTIKDNAGLVLYKELIEKTGVYNKGFDLTALPNGNYFFELDKDVEIKTIPFTVASNKVTFNKEEETIFYKPVTIVKKDLVYVSKFSANSEPLTIKIYGVDAESDSELLYTETIKETQTIEKIFKLNTGKYKIVFNSNNKDFTKFINN